MDRLRKYFETLIKRFLPSAFDYLFIPFSVEGPCCYGVVCVGYLTGEWLYTLSELLLGPS